MARIEVDIDYPEYDDEEAIFEKLKNRLANNIAKS